MEMDCQRFVANLDAFVEDALEGDVRQAVEQHLRRCDPCRQLVALRRSEPENSAMDPSPGLTQQVLARTTGSPCQSARDRLCGYVDGELDSFDAELVALHLESCDACSAVSRVLARMSVDLPLLAELEPDPALVQDVLARTVRRARPISLAARLSEALERLIQRPRIAMEGAYVGAFALAAVFLIPNMPLANVPRQALELAKVNPVHEMRQPVGELEDEISSGFRSVWQTTGGKVLNQSRNVAGAFAEHTTTTVENIGNKFGTLWKSAASDNTDESKRSTSEADRVQGDEK